MGFFRFKNKGKKGLDIPPAPPVGDLPSLENEFPALPEMPPAPPASKDVPEFPSIKDDFPPLESSEPEKLPGLDMPAPPKTDEEPIMPPSTSTARKQGPIYVEVDKYREILEEVNSVKDAIKSADHALQRMSELNNSRERETEKWHRSMNNIQKKLSFIDKNLFKGA